MNGVPEDLDRAVRAIADQVPTGYATLTEITARGRRMRRRRTAAVGSVAALAVLVSALGVPLAVNWAERTGPQPAASTSASPSASPTVSSSPRVWTTAAQRLLVNGATGTVTHGDGTKAGIDGPTRLTELLPTGKLRALKTPSYNGGLVNVVALPSGGLVALGIKDLKPGTQRTDGVDVTDLEIHLVVVRPDGTVAQSPNVRIQGEDVELAAADEKTAILRRERGLFQRDLASGKERRLSALPAADSIGAVSLVASAIAVVRTEEQCPSIHIGPLVGPSRRLALPGDPSRCGVGEMRFSPDGSSLAVVYGPRQADRVRLAVFDVATGALVSDSELYSAPDPLGMIEPGTPDLRGIAWLDDRTVRAAVTTLPRGATRAYRYTELLRIVDVQVR
ncbi:MAG: hypothetical protein HOU81_12575 [Hamadaea sp.]|uniref:hypothetical protein n=1 Tax=Hamadaea sp. TaxID=2024425 RepID=UPI0017CF0072|nr:hypothetical protein [Hamadaea sp.]NUR71648.1 hypothetical protein [Hamadaea sp.]NUT20212.1 hypothetical protein [Hamadaea sp.]